MLGAVAVNEILALKRHPVLYGDAAAERFDPFNISIRNGFAMIEEPVQTSERNVAIHFFIDVERARDGLVVGRVQAKWPTIFDEVADDRLELRFHRGRHIRPWLEKILEIRRRIDQHLARAVHPVEIVARSGLCHLCPLAEIRQLLLRLLRE